MSPPDPQIRGNPNPPSLTGSLAQKSAAQNGPLPRLISIRCPHCDFRFKVDRKFSGKTARCPEAECQGKLRIPQVPDRDDFEFAVPQEEAQPARKNGKRAASEERISPKQDRRAIVAKPRAASAPDYDDEWDDLDAREAKPRQRKERRKQKTGSPGKRSSGSPEPKSEVRSGIWRLTKIQPWQIAAGAGGILIAVLAVMLAPNGAGDSGAGDQQLAAAEAPQPDLFETKLQPFVKEFCQDCHTGEEAQAGIDFEKWTHSDAIVKGDREHWEKILAMIEIGAMPPPDADQPKKAARQEIVAYLEDKLYNLDCDIIDDPGRVTVRRLNRAEYNNTVRDLLGVTFKPADDFPSDDVGYGFDNMGDVLSLSPLLMEKYLDAAEQITNEALPLVSPESLRQTFDLDKLNAGNNSKRGDFWGLPSRGRVTLRYEAQFGGEFIIRIRAQADQAGNELAKMQLEIDGKPARVFDIQGQRKPDFYEHRVDLKPGRHEIAAAFINDYYVKNKADRNLYVGRFEVASPVSPEVAARVGRFVSARPDGETGVGLAAQTVLRPFIERAFRRRATAAEVQQFVSIVEAVVEDGESYDFAVRIAVQAVLVSPSFLFRVEFDQKPNDPKAERSVTDFELASRLSYFLWSSMPDEQLFKLARTGQLKEPATLTAQVKRMLKDEKSQALVDNFAEQWLNLRMLDEVSPDPKLFTTFNDRLRNDMKRETLMLFAEVMKQDRSVLDFLDADFTFVNERLAKHYGMEGVRGEEFQKVSLDTSQRAGVLTQASILTITSNPDRTSPVKRGKWILENILGKEPPPPPPGVPELEETQKTSPNASMREQLEKHRADPGCASCHTTMDALGFGFENFDAVGVWRDKDGQHAIDSSGELPTGEKFNGPVELVRILKARKDQFSRALAEKMLTYALGRGLSYYDRCAVDDILKELNRKNYRFSELVLGITRSKPFLKRRGDGDRE